MGQRRAPGEVERIERPAPAGPELRGAAERDQAGVAQGRVRITDRIAAERLGGAVVAVAARLEQADLATLSRQLQRQHDPGRAATDDHDVGGERRAVRQLAGIEDQAATRRANGSTWPSMAPPSSCPAAVPGPAAMNHARARWLPARPEGRRSGSS